MNELRSLVLRLLPLCLLASSCTAATSSGSEPGSENASPTSIDEQSFENAALVVDTAEELDRVAISGLAADINVDEFAAVTTFEGHDVVFAVHEDDAGFYIVAPLNPAGPGTDGSIEFQLTDGTNFGPLLSLGLTGLPSAPGAGAAYAARMRANVADEAEAAGTSFEELQSTSMADTSEELLVLKVIQELVDDGTENDLTSALGPEESGLSAEELALLDAIIAKVVPATQTPVQRPRRAPGRTTDARMAQADPPAPEPHVAEPTTVVDNPSNAECISEPVEILSAGGLVQALKLGVEAKGRLEGSAGQLDRDVSAALDLGTLVPVVGAVSAGLGLVLSAEIIEEKRRAGRYPSSLGELSVTVSETEFNEDFIEPGTWSTVQVTAISDGHDSAADLFKFAVDAATVPLAGVATVAGQLKKLDRLKNLDQIAKPSAVVDATTKAQKNAAALIFERELSQLRSYCAHTWTVDVTGLPYTRGRVVRGLYEVDSEEQTYSPTDIGKGYLSIEVDPVLFTNQEAFMVFDLDTHKSRLELSPVRIEVRSPGDYVDIGVMFSRSSTEKATWITEAGEFIFAEPETEGEVTRSLITPESPTEYPFVVTATISAETGLFALGPRVRLNDNVIITIAELLIDPPGASVAVGGQVQYTATTRSGEWIEVEWSATGGAIDKDGLFTAGDEPGLYSVTARAVSGRQIEATVPVRVVDASCLVGRWSLRAEPFFSQISALADKGTTKYISGEYLITMDENGGFQAQRIALLLEIEFEGQLMMIQIDSKESGTFVVEDDMLTINETQSDSVVEATIPGVGAVSLPVSAPNGVSGTGPYVCVDDVIEVNMDGVTSTLDYLGLISE